MGLLLLLVVVFIFLLPKVLEFAKVEEATIESLNSFAQVKATKLGSANNTTAIDVSNYPIWLKLITFLYRPLPFDVNSIPTLLAAIENSFLLFLTLFGFRYNYISSYSTAPAIIKFLLLLLLIGAVVFSQTLGNLGIMLRMRNMFLPALLFFFLWHFYYAKKSLFKS